MLYGQFNDCFNVNDAGFERTWLKVRATLAAEFIVEWRAADPVSRRIPSASCSNRELRSAMVGVYTNFKTLL
jgi:hypothetical protein